MVYCPRIHELRKNANLSQDELAKHLGIHKITYTHYESGTRDLPISFIYHLAVFYNISSDYILGLTDTPTPLKKKPGS